MSRSRVPPSPETAVAVVDGLLAARQPVGGLTRVREDAGLTQPAIAAACGIDRVMIGLYETGVRHPSREVLPAYAAVIEHLVETVVPLESLTPAQREVVLALIAAGRAARTLALVPR
jgi:transcriptional regulator with XRE-family HTH domain